jgi:chromate transporter
LNLAVWFALHVFFSTGVGSGKVDWFAIGLSAVAFVLMQRAKVGIVPVVLGSGLAGFVWQRLIFA